MAGKLLLIEDDDTTRELLTLLLSAEGWDVAQAASGEEAIGLLADTQPEVVLSDLQLPGISGAALADAIRQVVPATILAMTATPGAGLPEGFDALLVKPFAPAAVQAACEKLLHGKAEESEMALATGPMLDEAIYERMSGSMSAKQLAALYDFAMSDADTRMERMQSAVAADDDDTFRREAHALKGSAAMIGALQLRAHAATAEGCGLSGAGERALSRLTDAAANFRHMLKTRMPEPRE